MTVKGWRRRHQTQTVTNDDKKRMRVFLKDKKRDQNGSLF